MPAGILRAAFISQRESSEAALIPQSGLLMHIASTESVSLCVRMKS
jgi:hypothetical protein